MNNFNNNYVNKKFTKKELEAYKKTLVLTQIQIEVLIGIMLGDATWGGLREGKPVYGFEFTQGEKHKGYLDHVYQIFEPFIGTKPRPRVVGTNKTKDNVTYKFRTYRHNSFIFFHNLFNTMKDDKLVKTVPPTIGKFLTARSLAYWFMDDGTSTEGVYQICTDGFSYQEQVILKNALIKNFNLNFKIIKYKKTHRLQLLAESRVDFIKLVGPYINEIECMRYKIT
jgi:hypothetical protein